MKPELAATLRNLAKQTYRVVEQLDRTEEICECCGLNKRRNWSEARMAMELENTAGKLYKWAKTLAEAEPEAEADDENRGNR